MNETCRQHLERLTVLRPDYADGWYRLGVVTAQLGSPEVALAALEKAIEINPNYTDARIARAFCLAESGRISEGYREFRKLPSHRDVGFDFLFSFGVFCMRFGWKDTGYSQLQKAECMKPRAPYVLQYALAAAVEVGDDAGAERRAAIVRGVSDRFRRELCLPDRGIESGVAHQWRSPPEVKAQTLAASYLTGVGERERAEEILRRENDQLLGHAELLTEMGRLLTAADRKEEAVRWFSQAIDADEVFHPAYFELSCVQAQEGAAEAAVETLRAAVDARPLFPDYRYHLGTMLRDLGRRDEAIEQFQHALILNPDSGHAALHLAAVLMEQGAFEKALATLADHPCGAWPEGLILSAQAHSGLNQREEAVRQLEKALALDPTNTEVQATLEVI